MDELWGVAEEALGIGSRLAQNRCLEKSVGRINAGIAAIAKLREEWSQIAGRSLATFEAHERREAELIQQQAAQLAALTKERDEARSFATTMEGALLSTPTPIEGTRAHLHSRVSQLEGALREIQALAWPHQTTICKEIARITTAALSPAPAEQPESTRTKIERQRLENDRSAASFEEWWRSDGKFCDPDTEDVSWYDKREGLAAAAFIAGTKSGPQPSPLTSSEREEVIALLERVRTGAMLPDHIPDWLENAAAALHAKLTATPEPVVAPSRDGWHVGTHCPRNIWRGEEMVAMCHTEQQAAEIVARMRDK